jgi:hypothetical protein
MAKKNTKYFCVEFDFGATEPFLLVSININIMYIHGYAIYKLKYLFHFFKIKYILKYIIL